MFYEQVPCYRIIGVTAIIAYQKSFMDLPKRHSGISDGNTSGNHRCGGSSFSISDVVL